MNNQSHLGLGIWLLTGAALIFVMILLGGITRLTGSGLSMVDWNIIMGTLPPLNETEWKAAFEQYKQFPQYKKVNPHMDLAGFKTIFWWEYIHRLWGRLLGLAFIFPFLYFWWKRKIPVFLNYHLFTIFLLGALQGIMGWVMVKSGLVDQPWVSPYRLTIHLLLAFVLFGYLSWWGLRLIYPTPSPLSTKVKQWQSFGYFLLILFGLQLIFGGFMAGHKAALSYPTFPTMNGAWIPNHLFGQSPVWINFFENVTTIQFFHRLLAIVLAGGVLYFFFKTWSVRHHLFTFSISSLTGLVTLQFLLGVLTVMQSTVQIPTLLAVLHQAGAVLLFFNLILIQYLFHFSPHKTSKKPAT